MRSAADGSDRRSWGASFHSWAGARGRVGTMRLHVTKELFGYWCGRKGARAAPDRSDIDPTEIREILADTFILEVDADRTFPMRLAGTRINALRLEDRKGAPFIDLWRGHDRVSVAAAMLTVIDGVTPIIAGARARVADSPPLDMELLLLPLRHFGKTHSRVLGALTPIYQPDWLGLRPAGPLELLSLRIVEPQRTHSTFQKRSHIPAGQRPRLVVYEGGKS